MFVAHTSAEDWQSVFDLVKARGWWSKFLQGGKSLPLPLATDVLARPAGADLAELKVWPAPRMLAIFRFAAAE
ncbi:hypothetical protein [Amycolatopsis sp. WAC 01375]|uniref:hypothetical protein n=1 Tax=Amycolatopsis sp. WAC 01375 TaxID=2203194 RepID=UPI001F24B890|nr:hypothetical protein [Amycolatopsis sp. WAC 01375]